MLWSGCPGVGWVRLRALEALPGGREAAWQMPLCHLAGLTGWPHSLLEQVETYRQRHGPAPIVSGRHRRPGEAPVLLPGDPAWPSALAELPRPPVALHWRGQGRLWPRLARRQAIAVVGTRRPSLHGRAMARRLGEVLARAGWPVVSGLAEGIDAAVHLGCLEAGGAPVAVLGTPLSRVYPRHHRELQQTVGQSGLLISESPPGARVLPGHFAARNRLQVALARAIVVVECPEKSGALHSASMAWQQGLPLWVVPADAGKASALGSNRLLTQGATPLVDPADLLPELGEGPLLRPGAPSPAGSLRSSAVHRELQGKENRLLQAVGAGASLEQLCRRLQQEPAELMVSLLELELAGVLRAEAGLCWSPASTSAASGSPQ
ncbi:MAG: DNA-processing protein DprA [Cyanobacteriota bacterium]